MADSPRQRIVSVLSAPNSPLRAQGVALFVDHWLEQPLRAALELEDVHALLLTALTRDSLERIVDTHVRPGFARYTEAVVRSEACVGDLVSERARGGLRQIAREFRLPRSRWTRGALDPDLLRRLLGPVWVQVLLNFAKRFPLIGGAAAPSGLGGMLGRRAERLVGAGRSVMEGLGLDVEKRLLSAAREFSDTAVSVWTSAMYERFDSEEGRGLLAQIHVGVVEHVLRTRFRDLHLDLEQLPVDQVLALVPELLSHAARSGFVQDIVRGELSAFWSVEGERSLATLLNDLGVYDEARALLCTRGDEWLQSWAQSNAFADWLARLLQTDS